VVGADLTENTCRCAGKSLGAVLGRGARVCVGRDTRLSGPEVAGWLTDGLLSSGVDVVGVGVVPTPALAVFARSGGFDAGAMVTASHNPPEYNGIKLFDSGGVGFSRAREEEVEALCDAGVRGTGAGRLEHDDSALELYLESLPPAVVRAALASPVRLMLDPGNGAASRFACEVFRRLGLDVRAVNDTPDGRFPGRGSEPNAATLGGTCAALSASDARLAACFDGDADRVVFCDREGVLELDGMLAFVAQHRIRQTSRRSLATTVETGLLPEYAVGEVGGCVVRGQVGDVAVAHLVRREDAALGAESIGVYIFPESGLHPDSMLAVLHVLGTLEDALDVRRFIGTLPRLELVKTKIICPSNLKPDVMLQAEDAVRGVLGAPSGVTVNRTDGLRFEMPDAWLLVRPSGTEPVIRVTAEAAGAGRAGVLAHRAEDLMSTLVAEAARSAAGGGAC
jgi:phosphomannomutase